MAYRGGHARREEIARLLGFPSYRAQRAFSAGGDANKAEIARRRAALQERGQVRGPATPPERVKRVFKEPDGRFVRTNREAELRAMFRTTAQHDGRIVSCIVTANTRAGQREMTVWAKGGISGVDAWRQVEALIESGEPRAALQFIVDQLLNMGDGKYAPEGVTADDIELVQMAAEW